MWIHQIHTEEELNNKISSDGCPIPSDDGGCKLDRVHRPCRSCRGGSGQGGAWNDAGEAINITANNETIKRFLSQKFTAPNRRSVQAVLVQNSTYTITKPPEDPGGSSFWDINRSANVSESPFFWKVDLIERSCSCGSSGKGLYVATALIDPQTGEIVDAKTYTMSENKCGQSTCISACHK